MPKRHRDATLAAYVALLEHVHEAYAALPPSTTHRFLAVEGVEVTALLARLARSLAHEPIEADAVVRDVLPLQRLANLFAADGRVVEYCAARSELWLKPLLLRMWLCVARTRRCATARLVAHGVRSKAYAALARDAAGFDVGRSALGAQGYGLYVSLTNHLAIEYHGAADGTHLLGLVLVRPSAASMQTFACATELHDAMVVRDTHLWLPLGVVRPVSSEAH